MKLDFSLEHKQEHINIIDCMNFFNKRFFVNSGFFADHNKSDGSIIIFFHRSG